MISWVIGRGLLGKSVERALLAQGPTFSAATPLPWRDADLLKERFRSECGAFAAAANGSPWQVAWCAGAGVVGTNATDLAAETNAFASLLHELSLAMNNAGNRGAVFMASSAGGVYAGSADPPYDERSPERPLAAYGETKLAQERLLREWASDQGVPVLIGRIANIYGPGQDVSKPQGLISQLARAMLQRQPIMLYVPLDTIRDYLFAPDCGAMAAEGLGRLRHDARRSNRATVTMKIFASQQGTTLASVLADLRRILKRSPRVVSAASPLGRLQARDLRLRSVVWPELDARSLTPIPVGIHAVALDLLARLGRADGAMIRR